MGDIMEENRDERVKVGVVSLVIGLGSDCKL